MFILSYLRILSLNSNALLCLYRKWKTPSFQDQAFADLSLSLLLSPATEFVLSDYCWECAGNASHNIVRRFYSIYMSFFLIPSTSKKAEDSLCDFLGVKQVELTIMLLLTTKSKRCIIFY